ncbi:lisH domain-containing protein [Caerostris darwini]|uniref:LisH domain-containing protein n=1 Tax=Caerostris darwini TaxID=1538125 RepID=A0AAV4N7P2_9ARAC|nr:lisH domain-containing protein [Caerostris darwini]
MFRRRKAEKKLSADELKSKLYSHLDQSGSLNRMRTELREKLVSELLKKAAPVESGNIGFPVYTFDKNVLPLQISNWLVYDHLLRRGFQYTLSIFVTEANFPTHPEKLLAACDILILLGLDSNSSEYKSITQMCSTSNTQKFSHSLLVAVINCLFDLTTKEGRFNEISEIKDKRESHHEEEMPKISVQNRTLSLDSFDKKSDNILKLNKESLELNLHDQVQLIKDEKEKEIQKLRHKLLEELDRLHAQDRKQQLEMEQLRNEMQKEKDELFNEKEKFKQKELLIDKEYENKLERKTRELESDFITKLHTKEKDLNVLQQRILEKDQRLNLLELNLSNQKENFLNIKRELEDMKLIHTSLQNKYSNLLDENTNLLKKFESMSDYGVLKGDLERKSKETVNLLRELEELRKHSEKEKESLIENIRKLETKLRIKEPELVDAQKQLDLTRDTLHMEEAVWHKERRKLEKEVQSSREMYQTLIQRIEEQKEDIQALHRTIHILHFQLTDKNVQNTARTELFSSNKSSFKVPDITRREPEIFRISRGINESPPKYRENSLKFIEEAKGRISKLQQEADFLQNKCSFVYSSAPGATSQFTSNPVTYNVTTERRFQPSSLYKIQPFTSEFQSTHFENLIKNELPTLDLSFPSPIKNQFSNAFANIYKPEVSISAPLTTSAKIMPDDSDKGLLKDSVYINKKTDAYSFTIHSNSPTFNSQENMSAEIVKSGSKHKQQTQYDLHHGNTSKALLSDSYLKESVLNKTNEESSKDLLEEFKKNNQIKSSFPSSIEGTRNYESSFEKIEINPIISKPSSLVENSFTVSMNKDTSEKLIELQDNNKVIIQESNAKISDSSFDAKHESKSSFEAPIVVDLDAAWKRKSSIPSTPTPIPQKLFTEFPSLKSDTNSEVNFKNPNVGIAQTSSIENQNNTDNFPLNSDEKSLPDPNKLENEITEQSSYHEPMPNVQSSKSDKMEPTISVKTRATDGDILKHVDPDDIPKNILIDTKPIHEDSLSELSEIHLSCGSEQEQQKEDSDNW